MSTIESPVYEIVDVLGAHLPPTPHTPRGILPFPHPPLSARSPGDGRGSCRPVATPARGLKARQEKSLETEAIKGRGRLPIKEAGAWRREASAIQSDAGREEETRAGARAGVSAITGTSRRNVLRDSMAPGRCHPPLSPSQAPCRMLARARTHLHPHPHTHPHTPTLLHTCTWRDCVRARTHSLSNSTLLSYPAFSAFQPKEFERVCHGECPCVRKVARPIAASISCLPVLVGSRCPLSTASS